MSAVEKQEQSEAARWELRIGQSVYGPYTAEEMENLVSQGLLAPHSRIARSGSNDWNRAGSDPVIAPLFGRKVKKEPSKSVPIGETTATEAVNFALFLEMSSHSNSDLFQAIRNLGPASRISGTCWLLKSDRSAGSIRNALVPLLAKSDRLLVIDTSRSKLAWFNLGPEADSKIRKVWN